MIVSAIAAATLADTADSQSKPPRRAWLGFGPRLAMAISALIVATCSVLSLVVVRENIAQVRGQLLERTTTIAEQLRRDAEPALLDGNAARLNELAQWAVSQRDIAHCSFIGSNGRVWAAQGARVQPHVVARDATVDGKPIEVGNNQWEYQLPILSSVVQAQAPVDFEVAHPTEQAQIGTLLLGVSGDNLATLQTRVFFAAASVTLLVGIFGVIAAMAIAQGMTRPLRRLATAADAVAQGNLDSKVVVRSRSEIGTLASSFNAMVVSLKHSRAELEESSRSLEQTVRSRTERLQTLNRDLEEANRLKSEFLATMSHELRTPLHVIMGYASMMGDGGAGPVTNEQQELLAAVHRYSKLQLDLLTDVLDFSRLQSGKISFHVERFDLNTLLREVENLFQSRLGSNKVQLSTRVAATTPPVETDRIKLQEIVRNLVDNAVKFTKRGEILIEAYPKDGGETVVIQVSDTGAGIEPAELVHVFEPFRQIGESSTRQTGGVGLGLSIVKQLCEALGGSCTATSQAGVGSTFKVTIPRRFPGATAAP